jgi:hypothetical protein
VVLELKRVDTEAGETKEKAIAAALRQIRERDYAAERRARGAAPIHALAAVFDGVVRQTSRSPVHPRGHSIVKFVPTVEPSVRTQDSNT